MKLKLVLALSLASGIAFAAPKDTKEGKGGKVDVTTEKGRKELEERGQDAKAVDSKLAETGKVMKTDSKASQGIDYLKKVAAQANGNEVYLAAGGIAEAAKSGDERSIEVATRFAELIKSEKDVLKAFDKLVEEKSLKRDEVIANCQK